MGPLKYLNKYLLKYKYRLVLGTLFVVISNVFGIYPAQLIREAFDAIANSKEFKNLIDEPTLEGPITISDNLFTQYTQDMSLSKAILFFAGLVHLMALLKGIFTVFMRQTIIIMSRLIERRNKQ